VLLFNLDLLARDPLGFLRLMALLVLALAAALTIHEFSHALAAYKLGDDTARRLGRLSLNPVKHLDPLGALLLFVAGFGWGKPVPVNQLNLRHGQRGMALVALSGAASNIALAAAVAIPVKLGILTWHSPFGFIFAARMGDFLADLIGLLVFYNLVLAVFNLIPIPPLDGFNVALGILPRDSARAFARIARYGPVILIVLLAVGYLTRFNPLWEVMHPIIDGFAVLFTGRRF